MNNKFVIVFLLALSLSAVRANGQTSKAFFDSVIKNEDAMEKAPIVLPYVNPADVVWCKVIWRELVLREKMNLPLYYPTTPLDGRKSLIDLMLEGVEKMFKTAYEDDELTIPISLAEIKGKLGASTDSLQRRNRETGELETLRVDAEVHTDEVKRLQIKEMWFFNKRSSRMEVRIIALCPVREYVKDDLDGILKRELFWIDYNEFRDLFAKQKVYNFNNDAVRLSFDDVFLKRYFSSRIFRETNPYDNRSIGSYSTGLDAMLESDRIKKDMFNYEQDLWEY